MYTSDITILTDILQAAAAIFALVISFVTLRVVIVTLKEQIDLNKAQFKLLEIESNRAAREIRPSISVIESNDSDIDSSFLFNNASIFQMKNVDLQFEIYIIKDSKESLTHNLKYSLNLVNANDQLFILRTVNYPNFAYYHLFARFFDEDGRPYSQRIVGSKQFVKILGVEKVSL